MENPLAGCQAKLDRAREHRDTFGAAYSAYFSPRPFRVERRFDPSSGWYEFVPVDLRPVPLRVGVIVGDMVHNLRSALDHLVWQAVLRNGEKPGTSHQYPICAKEKDWPPAVKRRLKGVADADREAIRSFQPFALRAYTEGGPPPQNLLRLQALSNRDKHHVVTPLVGAVGTDTGVPFGKIIGLPPQVELIPRRDVEELGEPETYVGIPLDGTVPLVRVRVAVGGQAPQIDLKGNLVADFVLGDGALLRHALSEMAATVEIILRDFANRWSAAP